MPRSAGLPGLDEPQGHGCGTAPMASFFRTLKSELVHCRRFATGAGHGAVFARIDGFSNRNASLRDHRLYQPDRDGAES